MMEIRTPTRAPKQMCSTPIATAQVDLAQLVDSVLTVAEHGPEIIALGNRIASLSSSLSSSASTSTNSTNDLSSSSQPTSEKSFISTDDAVIKQSTANTSYSLRPRKPREKGSTASSQAPTVECEKPRKKSSDTHYKQLYSNGLTVLAPNFIKSVQEGKHYTVEEDGRFVCSMLQADGTECNFKLFPDQHKLKRHLLTHTPIGYKCLYCGKQKATFYYPYVYGVHCKEQHPEISFTLKKGRKTKL